MAADERKAKSIFVAVVELPRADRERELGRECAGDAGLRALVERLLENCDNAETEILTGPPPAADAVDGLTDFGPYERITPLGEGGMGLVYRAFSIPLAAWVALKVIRPEYRWSPTVVGLFETEPQNMARLRHQNIVPVHEVGRHELTPYFTMPLLVGGSLKALLPDLMLSPRRAVELFLPITQALHHAHQHGVIHRDLKPENVLLDEAGRPVITDLGLAIHLHTTRRAIQGGTPGYMAPEVEEGNEATTLSDIYGLGAILYAMLTGHPPSVNPAPPRHLNDWVDPDLEAICMKCLEHDPAERYVTAEAVASDLNAYLKGEEPSFGRHGERADGAQSGRKTPPEGKEPASRGWSWPYRLWRWCARNPVWAALPVVLLAVLGLGDGYIADGRVRERERQVLQSNAYTAQSVANTFDARLQHWSWAVRHEARGGRLRAALAAGGGERLKTHLVAVRDYYADPANGFFDGEKDCPLGGWFVLDAKEDAKGVLLAHSGIDQPGKKLDTRDYFQRASRGKPGSAYVSRVYHSSLADRNYKFAIAAPVHDGGCLVGVLVTTVLTDSAEKTLLPGRAPQKAVLVGRWDGNKVAKEIELVAPTTRHRAGQGLILVHPAFKRGDVAVEINNPTLLPDDGPPVPREDGSYRDPVAEADAHFAGRWLAASAPVENSEFVVIVQQEYGEAVQPNAILWRPRYLWPTVFALFVACVIWMAWSVSVHHTLRPWPRPGGA